MRAEPFERPRSSKLRLTAEQRSFLMRRTLPFMDRLGLDRPLSFVLEEVYLQGMRDAMQVLESHDNDPVEV